MTSFFLIDFFKESIINWCSIFSLILVFCRISQADSSVFNLDLIFNISRRFISDLIGLSLTVDLISLPTALAMKTIWRFMMLGLFIVKIEQMPLRLIFDCCNKFFELSKFFFDLIVE
jgi:hypothetical protein